MQCMLIYVSQSGQPQKIRRYATTSRLGQARPGGVFTVRQDTAARRSDMFIERVL